LALWQRTASLGSFHLAIYRGGNSSGPGFFKKIGQLLTCSAETANQLSLAGIFGINGDNHPILNAFIGNTFSGVVDTGSHVGRVARARCSDEFGWRVAQAQRRTTNLGAPPLVWKGGDFDFDIVPDCRVPHPCGFSRVRGLTLPFSYSPCCHPHRSSRSIAIRSSILPIPCLLLNLSVLACYPLPCMPKLILVETLPMATPVSPSSHSTPFLPIVSRLFCAMGGRNQCVFRHFWTLSIAMGVYTPSPFPTLPPRVRSTSARRTHELRSFAHKLRANSFVSHTCVFHGGRGSPPLQKYPAARINRRPPVEDFRPPRIADSDPAGEISTRWGETLASPPSTVN
jgi:hypothetical protein